MLAGGRYSLTRVVRRILVTNSQLTRFGLLKRVDSISHHSGLSLVTSTTAPAIRSPCMRNYGLTASECGPGYYYGQGCGEGQRGSQSDEWTLQKFTKVWAYRCLAVRGVPVPSVPGTLR